MSYGFGNIVCVKHCVLGLLYKRTYKHVNCKIYFAHGCWFFVLFFSNMNSYISNTNVNNVNGYLHIDIK